MDPRQYKSELLTFFSKGDSHMYPKNQIIVFASDEIQHLYQITEGFIKVYTINSRGIERIHVVYGRGDVFPLTLLLKDTRSNIFYQAMTDCTISQLAVDIIEEQLQRDPQLSYALLRQSIEQYKVYAARIYSLEYRYARERLAHRLLVLAHRFGKRVPEGIELQAPLTQQVIASSINLSRETVSREMERFVAKGYISEISRSGKLMVIRDPRALSLELPETPDGPGLYADTTNL